MLSWCWVVGELVKLGLHLYPSFCFYLKIVVVDLRVGVENLQCGGRGPQRLESVYRMLKC